MAPIQELRKLINGSRDGARMDWDGIERALGHGLPADYKQLVDLYGSGAIGDFIWILEPGSPNEHLDLLRQTTRQLEALRQLRRQGEPISYDVDSPDGHLIPWAITDNGDVCYWRRNPSDPPERWTVVVNEGRGPLWERFDGSATDFLVEIFSLRLRSHIFPEDFPPEQPAFRSSGK